MSTPTLSHNALADALAYARTSQLRGESVTVSRLGTLIVVAHENGHRRAYRQMTGLDIAHRLIASMEEVR